MNKTKLKKLFLTPFWTSNQILVSILGICSALAVTTSVKTALTMGLCVCFVTSFSCLFVSILRKIIPHNVRMIVQLIIISLFVIVIDQFLKAYFFEISKQLSIFVGLIITNCIVMGRCESIAMTTAPIGSFLNGLGAAIGYTYVILIIGVIREFFGNGSFFDFQIIPAILYEKGYVNFDIMLSAPGAFIILGILIWIANYIKLKKVKN
jgi:Na+-transporting NADH:ubiquinone oxidoreductase subunit D